jgi:hypothetical protein
MSRTITSEILIAYSQCPRKAFLLLCTEEKDTTPEYVQILQQKRDSNQNRYIDTLRKDNSDVQPYTTRNFLPGSNFLINATLKADVFAAQCGILTRVERKSTLGEYSYEPTIFVGAHLINNEHKLEPYCMTYRFRVATSPHLSRLCWQKEPWIVEHTGRSQLQKHERLAALRFGSKRDRAMFEDVAAARLRAYGRFLALWNVFMGCGPRAIRPNMLHQSPSTAPGRAQSWSSGRVPNRTCCSCNP